MRNMCSWMENLILFQIWDSKAKCIIFEWPARAELIYSKLPTGASAKYRIQQPPSDIHSTSTSKDLHRFDCLIPSHQPSLFYVARVFLHGVHRVPTCWRHLISLFRSASNWFLMSLQIGFSFSSFTSLHLHIYFLFATAENQSDAPRQTFPPHFKWIEFTQLSI